MNQNRSVFVPNRSAFKFTLLFFLFMIFYSPFEALSQVEEEELEHVEEFSSDLPDTGAREGLKYPSLMWEITGPGMRNPSYLYGTMHVSRKVAFHLGDTFFMAIRSVDVVALESNPGEWMENYSSSPFFRMMMTTRSKHTNRYSYRNFYRDLFFPDLPEVKTFSELLSKRYNVMNHMLYRKNEALADFEEKTYLDLFIFQAGAKAGKEMICLEDFEESRKMVREAETPPEKRTDNKQVTREQSKIRYRYGELIEDAYRKGDLDLLDSLSNMMTPYPKYYTYMIVKRNEVMANTIDSVIRAGKSIFAAAGAAHLPGDSGMIEMLREKGYTLRPVKRTINRSQHKAKEKIDDQIVKRNYRPWTSPDGHFSLELPGPLYNNIIFSDYGEYLYPDMINGSYYVVNRFPTYAPLRNHDLEYVKARFDSLIYEFIPGKINKFKEINIDGFPAYDITSTISLGDMQRYHIAFTPLEVMVFKMSGPGKYIRKDKSSRKFFSSIKLNMATEPGWHQVTHDQWGFAIDLPAYRIVDSTLVFERGTKDMLLQGYDILDNSYYMMIKGSFHDFTYIEEDTFELNFMAEQLADQFDLEINSSAITSVSGYPALSFKMNKEGNDQYYHAKIALAGPTYYLLLTTSKDETKHAKFFNSFNIDRPAYKPQDFYSYRDTTLLFEVSTVCDPPEMQRSNPYSYFSYSSEDKEADNSHQAESKETYFFNYRSAELIQVEYKRYHKYRHFPTIEKLRETEMNNIDEDTTFIVRSREISDSGLVNTFSVVLTDTNSSRAIHIKMLQKHGALYTLTAISDTLNGPSEFISRFFQTFTPFNDTLIGWAVFDDKGTMYLNDLVAEDSTTRAQARQSLSVILFEDHHAPLLMERIANPMYNEHTFAFRRNLISELGDLKDPSIPGFLTDLYIKIGDTVNLQLSILRTLAKHKSEPAVKAFLKCLNTDLPLTPTEYEIDNIFYRLRDSLQLAHLLYPEIFQYTRYREYEDNIYDLLATLLDSNIVSFKDYNKEFPIIFRNARDAWKRQLAREEEEQDKKSEYYTGYRSSWSTHGGSFNYRLIVYSRLLLPYYSKDAKAKELIDNMLRSQTMNLKIRLVGAMLYQGVPVEDSIIAEMSSNPATMANFYLQLSRREKLDYFKKDSLTQEKFSMSLMIKDATIGEKDSLIFLDRKFVESLRGSGYVYFFKKKKDNDRYWSLCWNGIQPEDTTQVIFENYIRDSYGVRIYDNDDLDELMDKEMRKIRLRGRERAERLSFEKDHFYFLFF